MKIILRIAVAALIAFPGLAGAAGGEGPATPCTMPAPAPSRAAAPTAAVTSSAAPTLSCAAASSPSPVPALSPAAAVTCPRTPLSAAAPSPFSDLDRYLGTKWYGVYFMDQKIGYAEATVARTRFRGKDAVTVSLSLTASVAMFGVPQELGVRESRTYLPRKGLAAFLSESSSGGGGMTIRGEAVDGKMRVTSSVGGEGTEKVIPRPDEKFEDYIAEERLVTEGAKVGNELSFTQYQPAMGKSITAVCRLKEVRERLMQGVPSKLYVIETTLKELGVTSTTLVEEGGEVIQAQVAGVYTMRLEDEKLAKNIEYRNDLILSTVIRPSTEIKMPFMVKSMKAVLEGVTNPSILKSSPRQKYTVLPGGKIGLTVEVEDLEEVTVPALPMSPKDFPKALAPSIFVQSDNPIMIGKARKIVGAERDARKVSDKIVDWVFRNLKKRYSATFSNALDVLATGEGDCTEHSVLYVALARAAGLPAREVSGVVYSERDGGFFYHQWAEAYVGKWIAVDPTFRQFQADATHIALTKGDLFSQAGLINVVGRLGIEITEYSNGRKKKQ